MPEQNENPFSNWSGESYDTVEPFVGTPATQRHGAIESPDEATKLGRTVLPMAGEGK